MQASDGFETKEVMIIDLDDRRIGLSIKAVGKAAEGGDYRAYLTSTGSGMGTLADALKSKLNRN
jgi:hypothetical protein